MTSRTQRNRDLERSVRSKERLVGDTGGDWRSARSTAGTPANRESYLESGIITIRHNHNRSARLDKRFRISLCVFAIAPYATCQMPGIPDPAIWWVPMSHTPYDLYVWLYDEGPMSFAICALLRLALLRLARSALLASLLTSLFNKSLIAYSGLWVMSNE